MKQEEENAAKAAEGQAPDPVEMDSNVVDMLIMLVDYPTTKKEYLALSEYGQNVNCFYQIYQVQENTDGTAPLDLKTAKEVRTSQDEAENERFEKFVESFNQLQESIGCSAKNAPIRNTAIFNVPYCDVELVELKQNEEGEQATNTLSAEQSFMNTFLSDYLEKYASFNLNFEKFRQNLELHQLMPEKEVMLELTRLKKAHLQYDFWKQEQVAY